jgi:hypothetical protein
VGMFYLPYLIQNFKKDDFAENMTFGSKNGALSSQMYVYTLRGTSQTKLQCLS